MRAVNATFKMMNSIQSIMTISMIFLHSLHSVICLSDLLKTSATYLMLDIKNSYYCFSPDFMSWYNA